MSAPVDTAEAVEARAAYLERDPRFTNAAAMLRRLHARAVEAERERDEACEHAEHMNGVVDARVERARADGRAEGLREAAACYVRDGNPAVFHDAILALIPATKEPPAEEKPEAEEREHIYRHPEGWIDGDFE